MFTQLLSLRQAFAGFAAFFGLVLAANAIAATVDDQYRHLASQQRGIILAALPAQSRLYQISDAYRSFKENASYPGSLADTSQSNLLLLFRAADETSFYTSMPEHAFDMEILARVSRERGIASSTHLWKTYFALVASREYARAKSWREENQLNLEHEWHELPSRPKMSTIGGLRLGRGGVEFRPFSFPPGAFMLAIAHPRCHFSRYAIADISADAQLVRELAGRSLWIAPQQREEDLSAFREWNATYREAPISQAYLNSQWPSVDTWETPTFYFYFNGVLKEKVTGWPREGRRKELYRALQSIGITSRAP